jgi:hypothetical protein
VDVKLRRYLGVVGYARGARKGGGVGVIKPSTLKAGTLAWRLCL